MWPSRNASDARLRDAQARIRHLEASLQSAAARSSSSGPSPSDAVTPGSGPGPTIATGLSPSTDGTQPMSATPLWFQVGIGEDGAVIYNGPTSRFHAGPVEECDEGDGSSGNRPNPVDQSGLRASHAQTLRSQYDLLDSVWAPLIAAKPALEGTGLDAELIMALLDIYWTWLHPLHNCVYRPCFVMDMALGGPFYSDFLLMCILGLAARHLPEHSPRYRDRKSVV